MGNKKSYISSGVLAAFLDGKATAAENKRVFDALSNDPELREVVRISQEVDESICASDRKIDILPMTAMAAVCGNVNYCALECEKYILTKHNIAYDEDELLSDAVSNRWQKQGGTALHNIGRHLEKRGFVVSRQYSCTLSDIVVSLEKGYDVIAVVDGGELRDDIRSGLVEDLLIGHTPNHAVVVMTCDVDKDRIVLRDPDSLHIEEICSIQNFIEAWNDSKNYLVIIKSNDIMDYKPHPIDLSDVELTDDLNELREAIAENAHEIWAENRQAEGWTYGPHRNDKLKQTPDMVPYSKLPDSEKKYDREMAMKTIKLLRKLGYDLIKSEDTELYQVLRQRLKEADQEYHCPKCGNVIYRYQIFCDRCGDKLNIDWSIYK